MTELAAAMQPNASDECKVWTVENVAACSLAAGSSRKGAV